MSRIVDVNLSFNQLVGTLPDSLLLSKNLLILKLMNNTSRGPSTWPHPFRVVILATTTFVAFPWTPPVRYPRLNAESTQFLQKNVLERRRYQRQHVNSMTMEIQCGLKTQTWQRAISWLRIISSSTEISCCLATSQSAMVSSPSKDVQSSTVQLLICSDNITFNTLTGSLKLNLTSEEIEELLASGNYSRELIACDIACDATNINFDSITVNGDCK